MSRLRVGFVGLGLMGVPMCRNLLRAGFPLTVSNRTLEKARPLLEAGARVARTPALVADASDVVLVSLATVAASEECFLGEQGALARARPGQVFVDLGTIGPEAARRLAAEAAKVGVQFLDAPVSGGPEGAEAATLTIMAGGDGDAFRRAKPVLEALGKNVHHLGPAGAGSVAKLVNQLLCFVHTLVAAEAITLGTRAGADPAALLDVMRTSFGQSKMLERSVPRFIAGDFAAGAPLRLYEKDLGLVRDVAEKTGLSLPLGDVATRALRQALDAGLAENDISALLTLYRNEQSATRGA